MDVLSTLFSGVAAIGAFISVFISFRQGYANIISLKRFDWMDDVRNEISEFIEIFFDHNLEKNIKIKRLKMKALQIELYVDTRENAGYDNYDHLALKTSLMDCIESLSNDDNHLDYIEKLVFNAQVCLAHTHSKAKDETDTLKKHF